MILLLYCQNCQTAQEQTVANGTVKERSDGYPNYDPNDSVLVKGRKLKCVNCESTAMNLRERQHHATQDATPEESE